MQIFIFTWGDYGQNVINLILKICLASCKQVVVCNFGANNGALNVLW